MCGLSRAAPRRPCPPMVLRRLPAGRVPSPPHPNSDHPDDPSTNATPSPHRVPMPQLRHPSPRHPTLRRLRRFHDPNRLRRHMPMLRRTCHFRRTSPQRKSRRHPNSHTRQVHSHHNLKHPGITAGLQQTTGHPRHRCAARGGGHVEEPVPQRLRFAYEQGHRQGTRAGSRR